MKGSNKKKLVVLADRKHRLAGGKEKECEQGKNWVSGQPVAPVKQRQKRVSLGRQ